MCLSTTGDLLKLIDYEDYMKCLVNFVVREYVVVKINFYLPFKSGWSHGISIEEIL